MCSDTKHNDSTKGKQTVEWKLKFSAHLKAALNTFL